MTVIRPALRIAVIAAVTLGVSASAIGVAGANSAKACGMLSTSQLRAWYGTNMKVSETSNIPQAQQCQWVRTDGKQGSVTITIAPARYYDAAGPSVSGIGEQAFLTPALGGWQGGAVKGNKTIGMLTPASNKSTAIAVLKALVAKL